MMQFMCMTDVQQVFRNLNVILQAYVGLYGTIGSILYVWNVARDELFLDKRARHV